ncbi:molybdate ABC transporter substrate-binding protein [Pedobacter nototheniae]|uniref:molybdate ABC transporter substrate-binding protein n=1 Tax=Pedobacter nototheniae TaxID=2488994 RepID=UPI00292FB03E|nr:molybdate ABC transporter substrate-binding protein [Pedobacter nototheniae]
MKLRMVKSKKIASISFLLFLLFNLNFICLAQTVRIAVAANAQGVIKRLQLDFKKRTGIETEVIIGASGKLTTQIMNGAPFDIFLSADTEFPDKLYAGGYGVKKPKVYALGSLIVCGATDLEIKNWQAILATPQVEKIAIANPKTAPYGRAAQESLKYYKLTDEISKKLVFGESISQINTYLQTGVVSIGFTTEAFLYEHIDKSKFKWVRVDQKSYKKIEQGVILLSHAKKSGLDKATRFYDYLSSPSARKIISTSGYHLPN